MEHFIWPIMGGTLIGISAVFLMLSLGKISGISGIAWGMITTDVSNNDRWWRYLFIVGLPIGCLLFHSVSNNPIPIVNDTPWMAALAGLLVGIGVKLANGCTSGHGVCGIGRFSVRSLAATATFMVTAIVTVTLTH